MFAAIANYKPHQAELARKMLAEYQLPIETHVGRTPELIRAAHACIAVSGSVSLELLEQQKPTVVLYRISRFASLLRSWFLRVKYITLVNLLAAESLSTDDLKPYDPAQPDAERVPFPEYLTAEDKSEQIAAHIIEWLVEDAAYRRRVDQLAALGARVGQSGAAKKAAEYILAELACRKKAKQGPSGSGQEAKIPPPHFLRSSATMPQPHSQRESF
jgi:lipid-A-disaccharide synthase